MNQEIWILMAGARRTIGWDSSTEDHEHSVEDPEPVQSSEKTHTGEDTSKALVYMAVGNEEARLMNKKLLLVTGATGKQGRALIHALNLGDTESNAEPEFHVWALTRTVSSPPANALAAHNTQHAMRKIFEDAKREHGGVWGVFCVLGFPGFGANADGEEKQSRGRNWDSSKSLFETPYRAVRHPAASLSGRAAFWCSQSDKCVRRKQNETKLWQYDLVLEHKESSTDALHETGGPALVESLSSVFARTRGHGTEG
ncbi:hypothetical protein C8J57DRAFT_1245895 [Mycena rebaudengoi]|nr:hypothetical protein C8J57DRAFT_1245895 [Mycena rebaudengoi]